MRHDLIRDGRITLNEDKSEFIYVDLYGSGPVALTSWTSSYSNTGVLGAADLGTVEKGERAIKEAARQLARLVESLGNRPKDQRSDHHRIPPTMPMPWNQNTDD
ncbi:MAG: hypothetical protein ABI210_06525 [Abditibacteriaceae bacterium]